MAELTDASGAPLITAQQAAEAKAEPFDKKKVTESRLGCANSKFPFICDYALEVLKQQATSLGTTPKERLNAVYRGGLTITTQIDPKAQRQAQRVLEQARVPEGPGDRRDRDDGARHRPDPGHGAEPAGDGAELAQGETFYNYAVGTFDARW